MSALCCHAPLCAVWCRGDGPLFAVNADDNALGTGRPRYETLQKIKSTLDTVLIRCSREGVPNLPKPPQQPVRPALPVAKQVPTKPVRKPKPSKPKPERAPRRPKDPKAERDPEIMARQPKLPYDVSGLHWTRLNFFTKKHSRNEEKKYCYCGENKQDLDDHCVQCAECDNWFHVSCTEAVPKSHDEFLPFQLNYHFVCKCCNCPSWTESFKLTKSSWVQTVISAQSHLMWWEQRACYKVAEVGRFIEDKWHLLCLEDDKDGKLVHKDKKNGKWKGPLNSYWTTHQKKFFTQPQRGY